MTIVRTWRTGAFRRRESPDNPSGAVFARKAIDDLKRCLLLPGNVHGAEDWRLVLEPLVTRYRDRPLRRYFRVDTAFARPGIHEFLEAEDYVSAIRLPTNPGLAGADRNYRKTPVSTLIGAEHENTWERSDKSLSTVEYSTHSLIVVAI